ncbi:hypothetical protein [Stenotrophomonas sp. Ker107b]
MHLLVRREQRIYPHLADEGRCRTGNGRLRSRSGDLLRRCFDGASEWCRHAQCRAKQRRLRG